MTRKDLILRQLKSHVGGGSHHVFTSGWKVLFFLLDKFSITTGYKKFSRVPFSVLLNSIFCATEFMATG